MRIFVDTSAFLAVLNRQDKFHLPSKQAWQEMLTADTQLFTSNYVLLETIALLQHRFGIDAVHLFENSIRPVVETLWVDSDIHRLGVAILMVANRRQLSLVDCVNFELMHQANIEKAFTFDPHFSEQGFMVIPEMDR